MCSSDLIILTQVDVEVRNRVRDVSTRSKLLSNVSELVIQNPPIPARPQTVIKLVMEQLGSHLTEGDKIHTEKMIYKHVESTHPVYKHMVKLFKDSWYHKLANKPHSLNVPQAAQCMEVETLKHAQSLSEVSVLNIRVHVNRYNKMLNDIFGVVETGEASSSSSSCGNRKGDNDVGCDPQKKSKK